jgi:hypothetical protein
MDIAQEVGVPLEYALTLLDMESSGGLNVYGRDAVKCGPVGGEVTAENYAAYKARRAECGTQGCGPMQLTYGPLQDRADAAGGCWVPEVNLRVGLAEFAGYLLQGGDASAFSRWNTGKPAPSAYSTEAMVRLEMWRRVIQGETTI